MLLLLICDQPLNWCSTAAQLQCTACLQSLDEAAELFEADDPLLAECAARVLARAGQYMRAHCEHSKREVPKEVSESAATCAWCCCTL
jgi:hypothetical protein